MNYQKIIEKFGEGRIGDVMEYNLEYNRKNNHKNLTFRKLPVEIFRLWGMLGYSKSLQDILRDEEVEEYFGCNGFACDYIGDLEQLKEHASNDVVNHAVIKRERLKNNLAQELFNFLEAL